MTPTEHEGTVAVDAAARALYGKTAARHGAAAARARELGQEVVDAPAWEDLNPMAQNSVREEVLPFVWAALEALPNRVDSLREEWGRRIKDDSLGNGHMTGHVTRLFRTREDALGDAGNGREGLFEDCELVVRRVTEWEVDEG